MSHDTEKARAEQFEGSIKKPIATNWDLEEEDWTPEEEKALVRALDIRIVPLVTLLYLLCFIDRSNIGNARIQGMQDDVGLEGLKFNWALTIFYIFYLIVEIPSNILLKHIGPKFYIPFLIFAFGIISLCTAFVQSFAGLCIARAFLGIAEGGTMPGIAFLLSCFYKRHELLFRIGIFVSASSLAGAFGGLLATGLSKIPTWGVNSDPIHSWRNIFFFEGLITVCVAIMGYFLMPSSPAACKFLTPRQTHIATLRIAHDHKESAPEATSLYHIKRALLNINNFFCAFGFFFINVTVQSFSLFLPTILRALGWTSTRAQLLTVPPYAVACCFSIFIAWLSDKHRRRGIYLCFCSLLTIIGYAVLVTVDSPNIKYMAVFFAASGAFPLGPGFLSWSLNNAAGPSVRAVTGGYVVSVGTAGAILATWTYIPSDGPNYIKGHSINLGAQAIAATISICAVLYIRWENSLRNRGGRDYRLQGLTEEEARGLGYRHPEFRYIE
ncbi:MFS general substrate transporter [Morchella conica CCBAS932]|uniref:MFS general substrate transporter n=1 Tax=Morchella conica CCBAS932 TaxID=1392247 RepID=A0A3N4KUA2_9PEZI|nr:MFS general substrate transporter [Morchella conica CCBAS932]